MDNRPIGMLDSGIGGLTVLKEFLSELPNENYIYYADTKHLPYGEKSKKQIISYTKEIVSFFLTQNVKVVIIACGTASSLAYEYLQSHYSIPIFDIITPTITNVKEKNIGLIATESSVKSNVWNSKMQTIHPTTTIHSMACPKLVPIAEKNSHHSMMAKMAVRQYLKPLKDKNIEALIMGCTHYPFFQDIIRRELGENIPLINIGTPLAKEVKIYLLNHSMQSSNTSAGNTLYYDSLNSPSFSEKAQNILEQLS